MQDTEDHNVCLIERGMALVFKTKITPVFFFSFAKLRQRQRVQFQIYVTVEQKTRSCPSWPESER